MAQEVHFENPPPSSRNFSRGVDVFPGRIPEASRKHPGRKLCADEHPPFTRSVVRQADRAYDERVCPAPNTVFLWFDFMQNLRLGFTMVPLWFCCGLLWFRCGFPSVLPWYCNVSGVVLFVFVVVCCCFVQVLKDVFVVWVKMLPRRQTGRSRNIPGRYPGSDDYNNTYA